MTIGTQIPVAWSPGRLPSRWWRLIISVFFFTYVQKVCVGSQAPRRKCQVTVTFTVHPITVNPQKRIGVIIVLMTPYIWRWFRFLANYLTPNTTIGKIWVGKYLGEVGRVSVCYYVGVCLHGVSTTTKNFTVVFAVEMLTDKPPNKILPLY